jgi:TolB-like protein/DNA-binding winged helix-turn-helix (wHTH) protein
MEPAPRNRQRVRFKSFELDLHSRELRKHGLKLKLQGQPIDLLEMLLEHPGELVTREQLRNKLWPEDTFGDFEHGLNSAINRLREALGDHAETPRYIETLPRRGYRFIAKVEMPQENATAPVEAGAPGRAPAGEGAAQGAIRWRPIAIGAAVLGTLALLAAVNSGGWRDRFLRRLWPAPKIESIAVLPLANLSGDPQQEYLADGMTDALITDLGQIRALRVVSRQSVLHYKGSNKPLPEIARELGVDGVVEGAVERSGDRVRVSAQLIHGITDRHLWAQDYELDARDLLKVQGEVAQAVAREIKTSLTPEEANRLGRTPQVDPEAYEAYLKGKFHWYRVSSGHYDRALSYFQLALDKDPGYAPAHLGIGMVWLMRGDAGFMPPIEAFPKARAAIVKSLELDEKVAEAHVYSAELSLFDRDWQAAEREFRRGIELNPNSADAHFMYADFLISMKRMKEWQPEMRRALELDPLNSFFQCFHGWHLAYLNRYDEAITIMRKAVAAEPGFSSAHMGLWGAFYKKGMYEEALTEADKFYSALNDHEVQDALRRGQSEGGYRKAMHNGAEVLASRARQSYVPGVRIARLYAHAGENDQAMAWLQKANEQREPVLIHLNVAWDWDALRGDTRFRELARQVGLSE